MLPSLANIRESVEFRPAISPSSNLRARQKSHCCYPFHKLKYHYQPPGLPSLVTFARFKSLNTSRKFDVSVGEPITGTALREFGKSSPPSTIMRSLAASYSKVIPVVSDSGFTPETPPTSSVYFIDYTLQGDIKIINGKCFSPHCVSASCNGCLQGQFIKFGCKI